MTRVLIVGCGYVGTAFGQHAANAGDEPHGLKRDPEGLPPSIHPVAADLLEPRSLDRIPEGVQHVVYAVSPDGRDDAAYADAYVIGLSNLLTHLDRRGDPVQRLVLTTSTGVYGQQEGQWVDEASPTEPRSHTGRRMLEAERLAHDGPWEAVALRLGGIYGPGRTSFLMRVKSGAARQPRAAQFSNRIHRDDCAGAIWHLLHCPAPAPVYIGVDHDPAELGEVQRWLAGQLGVPCPAPAPEAQESGAQRGNKRCRNRALVGSGYRFRFPTYREGYRAILDAAAPG